MYYFEINSAELSDQLLVSPHRAYHVMNSLRKTFPTKRLAEICSIASGVYVTDYVSEDVGDLYIRVSDVREYICNLNKDDVVFADKNCKNIPSRTRVQKNDILIGRTGTVGKAALVRGPLEGAVMSQHVTRLRINSAEINPGFLVCFLNSKEGQNQLSYSSFGSTRPELTHSAVLQIEVPLFPMSKQTEIGSKIVRSIDSYYESYALAESAVRAYDYALDIDYETNPSSVFVATQIPDPKEVWTPRCSRPDWVKEAQQLSNKFICRPIGEIASLVRGKGTRVEQYSEQGVPFVTTTDLINYGIDPFPDHYATEKTFEEFGQDVAYGDILFSIEGKIGAIAILSNDDRCVFKNHIQRLRTSDPSLSFPLFLYLASRSGKAQIDRNTVIQATLGGLSSRLKTVLIPLEAKEIKGDYQNKLSESIPLLSISLKKRDNAVKGLREASELLSVQTRNPLAL